MKKRLKRFLCLLGAAVLLLVAGAFAKAKLCDSVANEVFVHPYHLMDMIDHWKMSKAEDILLFMVETPRNICYNLFRSKISLFMRLR